MTSLRDIGEFGLIKRLTQDLRRSEQVIEGVGDDCAVVRFGDRLMLVSTDASVEDVHFTTRTAPPRAIGWKAAASAISDIAAMGGEARYVLVTFACPAEVKVERLEELFHGLHEAVEAAGAVIVGGDTTQSLARIVLSVTVIGEALENRYRSRRGARPGDLLAVTGYPGRSAAGLLALEIGADAPPLVEAHLHPIPRLKEGQWLAARDEVHAMIDVSDGLVQDTGHIAEASDIGVNVDPNILPISPGLEQYRQALGISPRDLVLAGGEDYELALAIAPEAAESMVAEFSREFAIPLTVIGQFVDTPKGVRIAGANPLKAGYDHFH